MDNNTENNTIEIEITPGRVYDGIENLIPILTNRYKIQPEVLYLRSAETSAELRFADSSWANNQADNWRSAMDDLWRNKLRWQATGDGSRWNPEKFFVGFDGLTGERAAEISAYVASVLESGHRQLGIAFAVTKQQLEEKLKAEKQWVIDTL